MDAPMEKIRALNKLVLETVDARDVFKQHAALLAAMRDFEGAHVSAWTETVAQVRLFLLRTCKGSLGRIWSESKNTFWVARPEK